MRLNIIYRFSPYGSTISIPMLFLIRLTLDILMLVFLFYPEQEPKCHTSSTAINVVDANSCEDKQESINVSCSVVYNGTLAPRIMWRDFGEDKLTGIRTSERNIVSDDGQTHELISSMAVPVNETYNATSFICKIYAPRLVQSRERSGRHGHRIKQNSDDRLSCHTSVLKVTDISGTFLFHFLLC